MKTFSKSTKNTKVSENTILALVKTVEDDIDAFFNETEIAAKDSFNSSKNTSPNLPML